MHNRFLITAGSVAIGVVLAFAEPSIAKADVKVSTQTAYYNIQGTNGKTLNASMLSGGKKRISLSHAVAATETELDFGEPKVVVKGNKCVVEDVDVYLKIKYTYPRWTNKNRASRETRQAWDRFYAELVRHEKNHGTIALAGAKALEKELMKMNGNVAIGCANFGSWATVRLKNVIRKTAIAQRNFDRREYAASSKISKLQRVLYEAR